MTPTGAFKTPEGEAEYLAAYQTALKSWPIPYEEKEIPCQYGTTHVLICGPKDAPPLVLLHGYMVTLNMWSPNIADLGKSHRVYAIDTIGQPGKSIPSPDEPVRDAADLVAWLGAVLDALNLDSVSLLGMSFGGWLAINFAMTAPERVQKLVLLSPAATFQPLARQFALRGMLMALFPTRLATNSLMAWMGFRDTPGDAATRGLLDLFYLGIRHFRLPKEAMGIMPGVFADDKLRALRVPVLLLIGEDEVVYDAAKALERARQLIPTIEAESVPRCKHDMCSSQYRIVDARVLKFLDDN